MTYILDNLKTDKDKRLLLSCPHLTCIKIGSVACLTFCRFSKEKAGVLTCQKG